MPKSVIITCAPTGGIHTPTMSEHLPITPAEIARASIDAAEAGASIIHLHARDPETGKPDPRPETFQQFLPVIKQSTDAVINVSTGAGLGMTMDERLAAATSASPEMASLNMGSMNFGIFPLLEKHKEWKFDWEPEFLGMTRDFIFPNTFKTIEYALIELGQKHGTKFEFECYDLGHLYNVKWFVDQGLIKPPFFIQFVLGILGGAGAELENLQHMNRMADKLFGPENYEWSVLGPGGIRCRWRRRRRFWVATCGLGWRTAFTSGRASWRCRMRSRLSGYARLSRPWGWRWPSLTRRGSGWD